MYADCPIQDKVINGCYAGGQPPTLHLEAQDARRPNPKPLEEWMNEMGTSILGLRRFWNIWEFDDCGELIGFGQKGRKMIREIANHLWMLHQGSYYSGELSYRVYIDPQDMTISFPFLPVRAENDSKLVKGIQNDTLHFRYIVGKLLEEDTRMYRKNELRALPVDLNFFFSKMFLRGLSEEDDLKTVQEHSFYLLYHPATYDAVDRIRFSHLVIEFRNRSRSVFESSIKLNEPAYNLTEWQREFTFGSCLHKTMLNSIPKKWDAATMDCCAYFPGFVRNVHHHYVDNCADKTIFHEVYDAKLERLYPGYCSIILDAVLRAFHDREIDFQCKLYLILKKLPFGYKPNTFLELQVGNECKEGKRQQMDYKTSL